MMTSERVRSVERLSITESAILAGWADGLTYAQVAERLYISPHTVKTYATRIFNKLDVHSKSQAVAAWERYHR